ncbi:hypothetical protein [Pseudarthrobacter sp. NS4]|uniref:hypothetical protein n=1 Tax=Pseudarthrobacter sp. NS4 TaxID=2973976 RepID=UPI0021631BBC|nr:hypothetical protein [Pseudarthrobacter sp. NS4]
MNPSDRRQPWTFAAVSVMVIAMTLLVTGLAQVPAAQLLPGYVAAYLLIGVCIFGPVRRMPSPRRAVAFLTPGMLLVILAFLDLGFWCGGWLLGLPAWGLLLSRWTPKNKLPVVRVLKFLALLVLGLATFTLKGFIGIFFVFSIGAIFLLPLVPIRLAYPDFRAHLLQTSVEVVLSVAAVVLALLLPSPEGSWSSPFSHAGGAAAAGLIIAFWARGIPRRSARLRLNDGVTL